MGCEENIEDRLFNSTLQRNEDLKKEIEQLKQTIELLKKKAMQNAVDPRILDRTRQLLRLRMFELPLHAKK